MKLKPIKKPVIQGDQYFTVMYWYTTPLRKGVKRVKNGSARRLAFNAYEAAKQRIVEQFRTAGLSDEPFEIIKVEDVSDLCETGDESTSLSNLRTLEQTKIHTKLKDLGMWFESDDFNVKDGSEWFVGKTSTYDVINVGMKIINNDRKNKGIKRKYNPLTPRDDFFVESLEDNDTKFKKYAKEFIRIFQHWPAATGKGSFPRLAYDKTFEPAWDYSKGNPINTIVNPRLAVLKGNLQKLVEHDLATKTGAVHVVFASDVMKATRDAAELEALKATTKVITNQIDFIRFIKENSDKTIWIHTTIHSYSRSKPGAAPGMVELLKSLEKSIYFSHIDEVHHTVLPDDAPWTAPLNNDIMPVNIRFMTSANKRITRKSTGGGTKWSMDNPDWCDYMVKSLTEKMAVDLGYKRQSQIWYNAYDKNSFPLDMVELIEDKKNPLVKVDGFDAVPLHWFMSADALIRFKIDNLKYHHTKLTLNRIENCKKFGEFIQHILKPLLAHYEVDQETFSRLSKIKIMIADTKSFNTINLLRKIAQIPAKYDDSFLIHCQLLGEGWDPENGWVDSTMFVDPQWSELKIYQDLNRATRIGDGSIKIHPIIMCGFEPEITEECNFSNMFKVIYSVGKVLEIGEDDIKDKLTIKIHRNMPKGGTRKTRGTDTEAAEFDLDSSWLMSRFANYYAGGKEYGFGASVNTVVEDWIKAYDEYGLWLSQNAGTGPTKMIQDMIMIKHWNFFEQFSNPRSKFNDIVSGTDFRVSANMLVKLDDFMQKKVTERNARYLFLQKNTKKTPAVAWTSNPDKVLNKYTKKFGKFNTINPDSISGNEDKFGYDKNYEYNKDDRFTWITWFRTHGSCEVLSYTPQTATSVVDTVNQVTKTNKTSWIRRLFRKVA